MRTTRISARCGLVVAAVAVPLALAAGPATAADISVSVTGTTVTASTTACPNGGKAALMSNGSADFAQGKQVDLTTSSAGQSASWTGVSPGTHTVAVVCTGGASAGAAQVTVSGTATPTPRPTSTATPRGLARGGLGGGNQEDTTGQIAMGAAIAVATGVGGTWLMRRRRSRRTPPPV